MESSQDQAMTMPTAEPQEEHRWLQRLVGEWTMEMESSSPGAPQQDVTGTESVTSLGDVWFVLEGTYQVAGSKPERTLMVLGYDPEKGRYVGTWVGSMLTYQWVYDGQLSEDKTTLTLDCVGPSMRGDGKMLNYRDVIELKSDDHRLLRGQVQKEDGSWQEFMVTHYRRQR